MPKEKKKFYFFLTTLIIVIFRNKNIKMCLEFENFNNGTKGGWKLINLLHSNPFFFFWAAARATIAVLAHRPETQRAYSLGQFNSFSLYIYIYIK